jgi:tripartite-type tricarboxylate transporter receptor subunit TctC
VAAVGEFLPGYEASGWYGIAAPKDTPADIIEQLNAAINAGLTDPKTRQHLADLGCVVFHGTPADFTRFISGETEKWSRVIRTAELTAN